MAPKDGTTADNDYLSEITGDDTPLADGAGAEDTGVEGDEAGGAEGAEGADGAAVGADGTEGNDGAGDGKGNLLNKDGKQQPVQGKGKAPDTKGKGNRPPGKGDLVDQSGQVIARAGIERRLYERAWNDARARVQPMFQRADSEIARLRGQIQGFEQAANTGKDLGLSVTEQVSGMKLMAAYKKDPERTINYLLTEAKASGKNIEIGGNLNTDAISRLIDNKLKPITDRDAQERQYTENRQRAAREINQFYGDNPQAQVHEASIAKLMERYPNLTLETAYLRLQNWMLQNGMNPNIPLDKQVKGSASGNNGGNGRKPMLNGRANARELTNVDDAAGQASTNDSYGSIVKRAMRTAGMSIN